MRNKNPALLCFISLRKLHSVRMHVERNHKRDNVPSIANEGEAQLRAGGHKIFSAGYVRFSKMKIFPYDMDY